MATTKNTFNPANKASKTAMHVSLTTNFYQLRRPVINIYYSYCISVLIIGVKYISKQKQIHAVYCKPLWTIEANSCFVLQSAMGNRSKFMLWTIEANSCYHCKLLWTTEANSCCTLQTAMDQRSKFMLCIANRYGP